MGKLCKLKAYNMNLFHTVQADFIAQTGDPTGTGRGGESIFSQMYGPQARFFEAETVPRIKHTKHGLISMVNCGDNVLGSQFFLTLGDELDYLDEHCVFGEVVEGEEVLSKINDTITDGSGRPYQDIRITHTVVLHDPYDDPSGLELRESSPEPTEEMLKSSRIAADENINDYAGKTEEEITEIIADKEAKARATILEMVGDIPDAEIAPPENVLFVCKLNPVTCDDDLEIIFSRFGTVVSCEVIKDRVSGDSLQYAFVEFADRTACEQAYFKMDNVLIDDRRIHVDSSQSVSKYRWKGKGRLEILDESKSDNRKVDLKEMIDKERAEIKVKGDGKIERNGSNLVGKEKGPKKINNSEKSSHNRDTVRGDRSPNRRDKLPPHRRDRSPNRRDRSSPRRRERSSRRRDGSSPSRRDNSPPGRRDRSPPSRRDRSPPSRRDRSPPNRRDRSPPSRRDGSPPSRRDNSPPSRRDEINARKRHYRNRSKSTGYRRHDSSDESESRYQKSKGSREKAAKKSRPRSSSSSSS